MVSNHKYTLFTCRLTHLGGLPEFLARYIQVLSAMILQALSNNLQKCFWCPQDIQIAKQIYPYLASTYPHVCAFELVKCDVSIARVVGLLSVALKTTCLITINTKLSVYYIIYAHHFWLQDLRMFLLSLSVSPSHCSSINLNNMSICSEHCHFTTFFAQFSHCLWGVGSNPTFGVSTAASFRHCRLGWALGRFKHQCVWTLRDTINSWP